MKLEDSITSIPGIGPKKAEKLEKLNIRTVEDMIFTFPREYDDRRHVTPIAEAVSPASAGARITISGVAVSVSSRFINRRKSILNVKVDDGTGSMEVVFFNARFLADLIKQGERYEFCGTTYTTAAQKKVKMTHPEFCRADEGVRIIYPVYPLTSGVSQKDMRRWHKAVLDECEDIREHLPHWLLSEHQFYSLKDALRYINFPENDAQLKQAKRRLIFDEFLMMQIAVMQVKARNTARSDGICFEYKDPEDATEKQYIEDMPFSLTGAQKRTVCEVVRDMESNRIMNRLIQGDVGSGKTAVAEIAMFKAAKCGKQAALMAPTEILARQHYEGIAPKFEKYGIHTGFLAGSLKASERKKLLAEIQNGEIDVIIGTHAIIQSGVEFKDLGLVITDEQHRFGVGQRRYLSAKGDAPDRIVMTATPIPRTLAVVYYGELDVSVIDEMPPGRKPVKTKNFSSKERKTVYGFAAREIAAGRQVYVVAPLIEDSEAIDARSASELEKELKKGFQSTKTPDGSMCTVKLLHGAMKQKEKDSIMADFYDGKIQVLVSTVVIEVGVNVPNASVMIIENAERFGLAQLHQLRGRVGRGSHQAYCCLITGTKSEVALQRAKIMEESTDGFYIAQEDLKLRGPGEIFGERQHGVQQLKLADPMVHTRLLRGANQIAGRILAEDPDLERLENQGIKDKVRRMYGGELIEL